MPLPSQRTKLCRLLRGRIIVSAIIVLGVVSIGSAQQPFITDDADTTPKHHFHFEFSNQFDFLQRSSRPNLKQNTADFELDFGVLNNLELGIEVPLLTIINTRNTTPRRVTGPGDTNISLKYNFLSERAHSRRPAFAIALNLEVPTGDTRRQLGSGLADFYMNGILQKSLTTKTKLRLNGGILFSGNETTGVVGIKTRGTVFTGAGSLVKIVNGRLQLGVELAGAITKSFQLGKGQLQGQVGGNYLIKNNVTFDFGVIAGKYSASPRLGAQVGVSIDF
ncbi:MAG TPA: transporter [Pyrinomonadaceae bacterium]|jgi:hypothetical protein|nr:transporter [Pyrinomonadaceae bacterium]